MYFFITQTLPFCGRLPRSSLISKVILFVHFHLPSTSVPLVERVTQNTLRVARRPSPFRRTIGISSVFVTYYQRVGQLAAENAVHVCMEKKFWHCT